jgi:hypothetical protein
VVDFLPDASRQALHAAAQEDEIVMMYQNNRAAEALVQGKLDDAYWWARAATAAIRARRWPTIPGSDL